MHHNYGVFYYLKIDTKFINIIILCPSNSIIIKHVFDNLCETDFNHTITLKNPVS